MLWRTLHLMDSHTFDQPNLNYALEEMGVTWHESINDQISFGRGVTLKEKISILLLPETIVCRRCDSENLQPVKVLKERFKSKQEYGHWKLRIDCRECLGNVKVLSVSRLVDLLPYLSVDQHRVPCNNND